MDNYIYKHVRKDYVRNDKGTIGVTHIQDITIDIQFGDNTTTEAILTALDTLKGELLEKQRNATFKRLM